MGNNEAKHQPEQAQPDTEERKQKGRKPKIYLFVLYRNDQQPQPGTDNLCDALDTYPPPGDITVHQKQTSQISDGRLPQAIREKIEALTSKGNIVLICLLADCDLGVSSKNIIVFKFKNPPVDGPYICVNTDFYTATPREMQENLGEVIDEIRGLF